MRTLTTIVCAVLVVGVPAVAGAQDAESSVSMTHKGQFGVHVQPGVGYRVLFPYNEEYCGQSAKSVCTGRSPTFVELGLSFGVSRSVELLADFRYGVEGDFVLPASSADAPHALVVAPGVKVYMDEEGTTKFFSTLQVAFDFTDFSGALVAEGMDVGLRNVNGVQIDLHRTFGIYLHFGETIGFVRWLRFELDAGIGLQARFP